MCTNKNLTINKHTYDNVNRKLLKNFFYKFLVSCERDGIVFFHLTVNFIDQINSYSGNNIIKKKFPSLDQYIKFGILREYLCQLSACEMIDFAIGVTELGDEKKHPHGHILLGFRAISNNIETLEDHILYILRDDTDVVLKHLSNRVAILAVFQYLTKELNDREDAQFVTVEYSSIRERWQTFEAFNCSDPITGSISCGFNMPLFGSNIPVFTNRQKTLVQENFAQFTLTSNLFGYKFDKKESPIFLMLYYVYLYFQINDMFLYRNQLYQKIKGSIFSYEHLGDLDYLQNNILLYVKKLCEYFQSLNIHDLNKLYTLNLEQVVKRMSQTSYFNKRDINFNVLEFNDCVYLAEYDRFIMKNDTRFSLLHLKLITIRYYKYNYISICKRLSRSLLWSQKVQQQFETKEQFDTFCASFANVLFQFPDRKIKKKSLFLLGESGAGKSQLIINIAILAFGLQNTGSIDAGELKFLLGNLVDKDLGILDEVDYSAKLRSTLLKILSNEPVTINQKFRDQLFKRITQNFILASNKTRSIESILNDPAFINRINLFLFESIVFVSNLDRSRIEQELPFILIYCAKQAHTSYYDTKYIRIKQRKSLKQLLAPKNKLTHNDFPKFPFTPIS